jgi:two-component system, NarL family, response regulator DevR
MSSQPSAIASAPPFPVPIVLPSRGTAPGLPLPPKKVIRVVLAHRSPLVRQGVISAFVHSTGARIEVVAETGSIAGTVERSLALAPDLVILDTDLPDGPGAEACRQILAQLPAARILMLSLNVDEKPIFEAIIAGAHGYVGAEIEPADLAKTINDVANGRSMLGAGATMAIVRKLGSTGAVTNEIGLLSPQEIRVLALISEGLTNRQVGQRIQLKPNTVKNYLANVFEKLKVSRRSEAVAIYVRSLSGVARNAQP